MQDLTEPIGKNEDGTFGIGILCNNTVSKHYKFLDFDENVLVIGNTYLSMWQDVNNW